MRDRNTLGVTLDEILAEIERLDKKSAEGFSIKEMMAVTGKSVQWCRERVKVLIDNRKAEFAGQKIETDIMNRTCRIPVYRLIK